MNRKQEAALYFVGALFVGYLAQRVARHEAAILGLTALDVAAIGFAVPVVAKRFG